MSIYTRTGDKGQTSLFGGTRVEKDSLRVSCYGTLDEANASLGIAYSLVQDDLMKERIRKIQHMLFVIGAELASDPTGRETLADRVQASDVDELEVMIDDIDAFVGPLKNFIIPGDTTASATLHYARSVVRRAERLVISLAHEEEVEEDIIRYLNRLSDAIFMLARAEVKTSFIDKVTEKVLEALKQ